MEEMDYKITIAGTLKSAEDVAALLAALESDGVSLEPHEPPMEEDDLAKALADAATYGTALTFFKMDTQYPMDRAMTACAAMGLGYRLLSGPAGYRDYTDVRFWEPGMDLPKESAFAANEPVVPLSQLRTALEQGQWAVRELLADYSVEFTEGAIALSDEVLEAMASEGADASFGKA